MSQDDKIIKSADPSGIGQSPDEEDPLYADWDEQTRERLKKKLVPVPEDCIGGIVAIGEPDKLYQVDSVLASGGFMVVFKMKNLETGECDMVLKVFKEDFDPQRILLQKYKEALRQLEADPDLVITITDHLLQLGVEDEALHFNKATAFFAKEQFEDALDCYDLAIAAAPQDVINWVSKAVALVKLARYGEAVEHLAVASETDRDAVRAFLAWAVHQTPTLKLGLRTYLAQEPQDARARDLFATYFSGPSRFRVGELRKKRWLRWMRWPPPGGSGGPPNG